MGEDASLPPSADALRLSTAERRASRLALVSADPFGPLERYRETIERTFGPTPHVDPIDGGMNAQCLLLLETPGPTGEWPRFVSRDNPTGTGQNLRRFMEAAGLNRRDTILWNAVP